MKSLPQLIANLENYSLSKLDVLQFTELLGVWPNHLQILISKLHKNAILKVPEQTYEACSNYLGQFINGWRWTMF